MSSAKIQLKKILWVGPLSVVLAIVGVLIVNLLAVVILQPVNPPPSLRWVFPTIFTLVLCTGGVLVFALVARFAPRPILVYDIIALVFLLISFIPDVMFAQRGGWPIASALIIMHIVAGGINVGMLTTMTLEK